MGACGSSARTQPISEIKLLLLGGANVGKSTIFKQMRVLYMNGFEEKDRVWAKGCIIENILETLVDLDASTDDHGVQVLEENEDLVDEIKPVLLNFKVRDQNKPCKKITVWDAVERLWSDPGIQAVYQEILHPTKKHAQGSDKILPSLTGYFLQQLGRIKRDDYVPSDDDILHLRRSTSDSDSIHFKMDVVSLIGKATTLAINCVDVGGQAHERTEWGKHAENLNAILYVISLPEYSNVNSNGVNVLQMQLDILKMVAETECFNKGAKIVLLNKVDLLKFKLQGLNVNEFFPDYTGDNGIDSVLEFFKAKVAEALGVQEVEQDAEHSNIVTTCATDTRLMRTIIEKIGQTILQKTLAESKFFG